MEIAPFKVMIIAPKEGSKEYVAMDQVFRLYDQLNNSNMFFNDVIIDDRPGVTVGKKLRDAKKTGYTGFYVLYVCIKNADTQLSARDKQWAAPTPFFWHQKRQFPP